MAGQNTFPKEQNNQPVPVLSQVGANTTLKISPSGSHTESTAINARVVRIAVTAAMNIEFGTAGVAATSASLYMPANSVEYFAFIPNQLVSALGTGDVYITPVD